MITTNIPTSSSISAVKAKVDIYDGTTLVKSCTCSDDLQDFIVTREGDTSKFFGFGVTHKAALSFIDTKRTLDIKQGNTIEIGFGDGTNFDYPYPTLYVTEVAREEKSNSITVTALDILYKADLLTVRSVVSGLGTQLADIIRGAAIALYEGMRPDAYKLIGCPYESEYGGPDYDYDPIYSFSVEDPNIAPTESLRTLLNALAEATHCIYYIDNQGYLVFRRLDKDGEPVLVVNKSMYYELTTQTPRVLTNICSATELGDNLYAGDSTGVTQYIRENPFWTVDTSLGNTLDYAVRKLAGLTMTQLECDWEGNHCLEIGDKVAFETEDGELVNCFILDDIIDYQGYINEITAWEFTQDEGTTAANPTSIGDKINQTVARVDKINKEITLMVSDVEENKSSISELQLRSDEINASVKAVNADVETLTQEVNLKVDSEAVSIVVGQVLSEGVDKVVTASKKYTFDDNGLEISSSDSEIETLITEDGMTIYKNNSEVLIADNQGVKATDLHARTFLIIGENSRLEDKGNRTACFWIGPAGG